MHDEPLGFRSAKRPRSRKLEECAPFGSLAERAIHDTQNFGVGGFAHSPLADAEQQLRADGLLMIDTAAV
jgi:hypothetical protein